MRIEPVQWEDALKSAMLAVHHNDPMDRIIIATAARLGLPVATPDAAFARYSEVTVIW